MSPSEFILFSITYRDNHHENIFNLSIYIISVGALLTVRAVRPSSYTRAICGRSQVTFQKQYQMVHKKRRLSNNFEPIHQYFIFTLFQLYWHSYHQVTVVFTSSFIIISLKTKIPNNKYFFFRYYFYN